MSGLSEVYGYVPVGDPVYDAHHALPLTVVCPTCRADIGEKCVNPYWGNEEGYITRGTCVERRGRAQYLRNRAPLKVIADMMLVIADAAENAHWDAIEEQQAQHDAVEMEREQAEREAAEKALQDEWGIKTDAQLYLVESYCGGDRAEGGGCGALYVVGIREALEGDRIIDRDAHDDERHVHRHDFKLWFNWPRAHEDDAILAPSWVCSSCRRHEW